MVVTLKGSTRDTIGFSFGKLLAAEMLDSYSRFMHTAIPNVAERVVFEAFADWLWSSFAAPHVPAEFHEELSGLRKATPRGAKVGLDIIMQRVSTLANLPADPQNIITMLQHELEKGVSPAVARLLNAVIDRLDHCSWCDRTEEDGRVRLPTSPRCDAFGVWGSRTQNGRLFSSRNLDWKKDTGISRCSLTYIPRPSPNQSCNRQAQARHSGAHGWGQALRDIRLHRRDHGTGRHEQLGHYRLRNEPGQQPDQL